MAGWNGSGVVVLTHDWTDDRDADIKITASRMDTQFEDLRSAVENTITKDGQNVPTTNLPMGGQRHTGAGTGIARTDYATVGQLVDQANTFVAAGGTADALTAGPTPAVTALADGMQLHLRAGATNLTTTPTLDVSGLGAKTITKFGNVPLLIGDIYGAGHEMTLRYRQSTDKWELLNPMYTPTSTPIGGVMSFAGSSAPTGWLLMYGQTLDSVALPQYAALYSVITTTYGGSGPSAFVIPDLRGRVVAGHDAMGGSDANRLTANTVDGVDGGTLGNAGGFQSETLVLDMTPQHDHDYTQITYDFRNDISAGSNQSVRASANSQGATTTTAGSSSPNPVNIVQPTFILNHIIRYQ